MKLFGTINAPYLSKNNIPHAYIIGSLHAPDSLIKYVPL